MNDPIISIIIPVYNAERFLTAAIESILAQTYKTWELILINDGSEDQSGTICDQYADQHAERIRVIHQSNKGVSYARNAGIDAAVGEFLIFVDSDDTVAPDYLQTLYLRHRETGADMVGSWFEYVDINLAPIPGNKITLDAYYSAENIHLFAKKNPEFFGTACGKLFRKSLINAYKLRFNAKLCRGEDTLFTCSYASVCKNIATSSKKQYYYRIYNSSSTARTEAVWLEQSIRVVEEFVSFGEMNNICTEYVRETSLSMRFDILGDFMKVHASISNMRNYLNILHSSKCFQEYIRHFKPCRRIVMLLYTYLMLYTPKVIQPYIFTVLNRCRHYIKSVFLLISLPATR